MATTALDGTFTMDRIAGDGDYKLSVSAFSGAPQPLAWNGEPPALVHVADGDALVTGVHLAVVLPSTTVRGTVLDDAELPVPDAVVRASPSAVEITAGTAWPLTRTNGDGQFAIRIVGDGPFRLEASMGGRPRARVDNVERGATDVVLRLARVGSLEGKLVNLTGGNVTVRALAGASTAFAPAMYFANVDEDTFHLADLTPGDYAISAVSLDGHSAAAVATVQAGLATSVTLSAANTRHLHASVVLFGTGAPVAGVRCVTLAAIGDVLPVRFGFPQAVQAISDASGQLEFETAPTGDTIIECDGTAATSSGVLRVTDAAPQVFAVMRPTGGERPGAVGIVIDWSRLAPTIGAVVRVARRARPGLWPVMLSTRSMESRSRCLQQTAC